MNLKNLRIIVIDDDSNMTEMVKDFMETKFPQSDITAYTSGESALEQMFQEPDIIVLDYHLDSKDPAAMNGLQILKKIRDRYQNVPVVFLSGQEKAEIAANTMKYGAFDYIVKNQHAFERLELVLRNIIGQTSLRKNLGAQKFFNYLLAALVVILIGGIVWMRING